MDGSWQDKKGSHRAYKHPTKQGIVTIAYHRIKDEIPKGKLSGILKQADVNCKRILRLINHA